MSTLIVVDYIYMIILTPLQSPQRGEMRVPAQKRADARFQCLSGSQNALRNFGRHILTEQAAKLR